MENEGELYTRIQQAFNESIPDDLSGQVAIDRQTKLSEIKKILDEMLNEFRNVNVANAEEVMRFAKKWWGFFRD